MRAWLGGEKAKKIVSIVSKKGAKISKTGAEVKKEVKFELFGANFREIGETP